MKIAKGKEALLLEQISKLNDQIESLKDEIRSLITSNLTLAEKNGELERNLFVNQTAVKSFEKLKSDLRLIISQC